MSKRGHLLHRIICTLLRESGDQLHTRTVIKAESHALHFHHLDSLLALPILSFLLSLLRKKIRGIERKITRSEAGKM